jgi:ABC-type Fe3+ transport system substrate-binding protein
MYMIICIYMVFSAFNLLEDGNISLAHKISYALLILGPLGVTVYSVWRRNVQLENGVYPATAWCLPAGIASAVAGAALALFEAGIPGATGIVAIGGVIAAVVAFFGVSGLRNLRAKTTVVYFDLPGEECARIAKLFRYEPFPKVSVLSMERGRIAGLFQGNAPGAAHAAVVTDPKLVDELKRKKLLAEQTGEERKEFPAFLKDPDNLWTGVMLNPIVVAVDAAKWKKVREADAQPLHNLETLLSPNLVGAYAIPDPGKSEAGRLFRDGLLRSGGGELFANLLKQAGKRLADPIDYQAVFADADLLVAIGFLHDVLPANRPRQPLAISFAQGAGWEMSRLIVPKNSPDPDLSRAFAEFAATKQGNAVLALKAGLLPGHPKALVPPGSPPRAAEGLNEAFLAE